MRPFAGIAVVSSLLLGSTSGMAWATEDGAARPTFHRLAGAELGKAGRALKPAPMRPAAVQPPLFGLHAHYDQDGNLTMQCDIVREARATGGQDAPEGQEQ